MFKYFHHMTYSFLKLFSYCFDLFQIFFNVGLRQSIITAATTKMSTTTSNAVVDLKKKIKVKIV